MTGDEVKGSETASPLDLVHQIVLMAIERGCLQHLIFDNQALFSHRAMAAILGVILRLPLMRQLLASRQLQSRYLEYLIERGERFFSSSGVKGGGASRLWLRLA